MTLICVNEADNPLATGWGLVAECAVCCIIARGETPCSTLCGLDLLRELALLGTGTGGDSTMLGSETFAVVSGTFALGGVSIVVLGLLFDAPVVVASSGWLMVPDVPLLFKGMGGVTCSKLDLRAVSGDPFGEVLALGLGTGLVGCSVDSDAGEAATLGTYGVRNSLASYPGHTH